MATTSAAGLDATALQRQVDAVLAEELYWFPVRHHSPAVARQLAAVVQERRPKIIFLEAPAEAQDLCPHLIDPKTKPPVAIYSCYRDDANVLGLAGIASPAPDIPPRFASWYPLVAYSPEYVALAAAAKIKADVVFMDLPHHALLEPPPKQDDTTEEAPSPAGAKPPIVPAWSEDDRLLAESGFYQALAREAGYRTWNEAWDAMFEVREFRDAEEFRRELAAFCAAARATTPAERISRDGTLERERHMWKTIGATLAKRKIAPKNAMVVCGGFHLFLDREDQTDPPEPPAGTVYTTVVPYSYFRISELSGYGAGNRAPQYYQRLWEWLGVGRKNDLSAEHVVTVLKHTRKGGEAASAADAIAICQHARLLARLRGRATPILDDLHDAIITCVCKGNPVEEGGALFAAIDQADIGNAIGKVTPALGRLPIVEDFYHQLEQLDLAEVVKKEKRIHLDLDKRDEPAQRRSAFLHRLGYLEIELAALTQAPHADAVIGRIFREKWALRWSPQIEAKLVEQSLYGDTIEAAVLAKLQEDAAKDENHAGKVCARLVQAADMDLPHLIIEMYDACSQAIDHDGQFISLARALTHLGILNRYAGLRQLQQEQIEELLVRCYQRACFALPEAASAPEEQQADVVAALQALAEVLIRDQALGLDRALFTQHVRRASRESTVPFLRGAFLGMLAELRDLPAEDLAAEVSALARAPEDVMVTAGDFVDGIMAVSRTSIMLGAEALVRALDELLRAAEWAPFLTMLPRLRAACQRLPDHQVRSLADQVAKLYGLKASEALTELRTSVGAAARIARIDQQVAEIMKEWDFAHA
jgi:hypothetical protein